MKKILTNIKRRIKGRHQRFYHSSNQWWLIHAVVDLLLLLIVILMISSDFSLYLNRPDGNLPNYFFAPAKTATSAPTVIKNKYPLPQPELNFKALARYTLPEGDQIGVGPLPPQTGETTRYWVFFSVSVNNGNFNDLRAEGTLGKNVRFTGRTFNNSPYSITYNNDSETINWQVEQINFNELLPLISAVEVEITPDTDQSPASPVLVSDIKVQAKDEIGKKTIIKKIANILIDKIK